MQKQIEPLIDLMLQYVTDLKTNISFGSTCQKFRYISQRAYDLYLSEPFCVTYKIPNGFMATTEIVSNFTFMTTRENILRIPSNLLKCRGFIKHWTIENSFSFSTCSDYSNCNCKDFID